jgi:hypothetical protein
MSPGFAVATEGLVTKAWNQQILTPCLHIAYHFYMDGQPRLGEIIANSVTHGVGAVLAIVGAAVLLGTSMRGTGWQIGSCAVFGAAWVSVPRGTRARLRRSAVVGRPGRHTAQGVGAKGVRRGASASDTFRNIRVAAHLLPPRSEKNMPPFFLGGDDRSLSTKLPPSPNLSALFARAFRVVGSLGSGIGICLSPSSLSIDRPLSCLWQATHLAPAGSA